MIIIKNYFIFILIIFSCFSNNACPHTQNLLNKNVCMVGVKTLSVTDTTDIDVNALRVVIFASYSDDKIIHDYILSYLKGYLFAQKFGWLELADELILSNDSCFCVSSLNPIFNKMIYRNLDFWGMTESFQIQDHLQSYFLVFSKKVYLSNIFKNYLLNVSKEESVWQVILKYEVPLKQLLEKNNFNGGGFITSWNKKNPTLFPLTLLQKGFPLIKRKVFSIPNFTKQPISEVINYLENCNTNATQDILNYFKLIQKPISNKLKASPLKVRPSGTYLQYCSSYRDNTIIISMRDLKENFNIYIPDKFDESMVFDKSTDSHDINNDILVKRIIMNSLGRNTRKTIKSTTGIGETCKVCLKTLRFINGGREEKYAVSLSEMDYSKGTSPIYRVEAYLNVGNVCLIEWTRNDSSKYGTMVDRGLYLNTKDDKQVITSVNSDHCRSEEGIKYYHDVADSVREFYIFGTQKKNYFTMTNIPYEIVKKLNSINFQN
ncbi:hypothetical protein PIROE2DRAFT_1507 [Piromyces sp. E2]|nr:hypothetical protein PIROE2DRAFT_1507 [Piromyces sp. E2]|eukprot:OUM70365.1 hypothetical protein PIROE2DRAFT_1507 [Piromyces sp. E2]